MATVHTADTPYAGSLKEFEGGFLIFRRLPGGGGKNIALHAGGARLPFYRHPTLNEAETEARRLCARFPESTFVIMREMATVKVRTAESVSA